MRSTLDKFSFMLKILQWVPSRAGALLKTPLGGCAARGADNWQSPASWPSSTLATCWSVPGNSGALISRAGFFFGQPWGWQRFSLSCAFVWISSFWRSRWKYFPVYPWSFSLSSLSSIGVVPIITKIVTRLHAGEDVEETDLSYIDGESA